MKEHDGLAVGIAAFRVVETRPGLETDVLQPRGATLDHAAHRDQQEHADDQDLEDMAAGARAGRGLARSRGTARRGHQPADGRFGEFDDRDGVFLKGIAGLRATAGSLLNPGRVQAPAPMFQAPVFPCDFLNVFVGRI